MTQNPFETLSLKPRFDLPRKELDARMRSMQRVLHPDKHAQAAPAERRAALGRAIEVNAAYRTLKDDLSRAVTLQALLSDSSDPPNSELSKDPAFLMEMMEHREQLAEARTSSDASRVGALAEAARERQSRIVEELRSGFALAAVDRVSALRQIDSAVQRLRYCRRLLDDIEAVEDDLLG